MTYNQHKAAKMRPNKFLVDELWQKIKIDAVMQHKTLGKWFEEAAIEHLKRYDKEINEFVQENVDKPERQK